VKKLLASLIVTAGFVAAGATSASAAVWCQDDPLVYVGTPITYSVNVSGSTSLLGGTTYNATVNGNSSRQQVAGGVGLFTG
jgi:hypothetical protein